MVEPSLRATGLSPGSVAYTVFDATEGADVPALFVAVTVSVTGCPAGRPVTVIGDPEPVAVCPVDARAVYEVAPVLPVNVTVAALTPAVAETFVGGAGAWAVAVLCVTVTECTATMAFTPGASPPVSPPPSAAGRVFPEFVVLLWAYVPALK